MHVVSRKQGEKSKELLGRSNNNIDCKECLEVSHLSPSFPFLQARSTQSRLCTAEPGQLLSVSKTEDSRTPSGNLLQSLNVLWVIHFPVMFIDGFIIFLELLTVVFHPFAVYL